MPDAASHPVVDLPVVDVVVATRGNRPALLESALAAIRDQRYDGDIVTTLVFDQTPPDHSYVVETGPRRVQVVGNDRTAGLAGARNSGIAAGSGELVAFCDDDDMWLPDKVARQVAALAGSASDTCVTGVVIEYADHEVPRVPNPDDMTVERLVRQRVMEAHPSTVMVRRSALVGDIGLVDEEIPGSFGEDYDWIIRAARHGGFAVVQEPLVRVRWGQSMFSRDWPTIIAALDYLVDKHPEFAADRGALARISGQQAFALAALGRRREALRRAAATARLNPRERRTPLAVAVALRLVSAERLMTMAHRRGRGI